MNFWPTQYYIFQDNGLTLTENLYQLRKVFWSKQLLLADSSPVILSTEQM